MIGYESMKFLMEHLGLPKMPLKHWSDSSRWEIAESINNVISAKTKSVVRSASFIALSCDEVTALDYQSWIPIHAYVIKDWEQVPVLLRLEQCMDGTKADSLTKTMLSALKNDGGLTTQKHSRSSYLLWISWCFCIAR
jgi:hypothetical protein